MYLDVVNVAQQLGSSRIEMEGQMHDGQHDFKLVVVKLYQHVSNM